jgi:hypothetical protein
VERFKHLVRAQNGELQALRGDVSSLRGEIAVTMRGPFVERPPFLDKRFEQSKEQKKK